MGWAGLRMYRDSWAEEGASVCQVDHAAAAVAALTAAYPHLTQEGSPHPALAGYEDVAWSGIPGCPEGVPVVLRGLLDPDTAEEAERALGGW